MIRSLIHGFTQSFIHVTFADTYKQKYTLILFLNLLVISHICTCLNIPSQSIKIFASFVIPRQLFLFKLNFFTVLPGLLLAFMYLITLLKIFLSLVSNGSLINFKYLYRFRDYHSCCPLILFFVAVDHIDHNYFLFTMSNQSLLIINYHHFVYVNL